MDDENRLVGMVSQADIALEAKDKSVGEMLADIGEWAAMNAVYRTYFPDTKPARSAFGASGLVLGGRLELECIAAAR